ncbi:glycerol-3-phosphate dehydrogenase/oxidase [Aureisphaera galaxeae]|uniref:glycerol-3-phosphate dehydrogenase/oxidase n=1 Tax=Aureisphaera galaxeae TaxID=1538023 RepID=UPI0023509ABF|nr:glycerol-3-phosphate dehydrogenase/oxidase [Aureisphaera galaxeae]MDC8002689.1 glycerol-3-phosphate dehydrogenase/oxidase [Aureisphaera galaxeae]
MKTRSEFIQNLNETPLWDIAIIGGGASGLGIAVDAASRGFKTVLFEKYDFAKGTSSKSTKLVHGGVRYLAQGNVKLVSEALEERGLLARNAQHLFKKQEFIIPNYKWWGGPFYTFGLKFYDVLAKRLSLGSSKWLKRETVIEALPTLMTENLSSGVSYFDGQFDDARLALNLAQTAVEHGATVLNYFPVSALNSTENATVDSIVVTDSETQEGYNIKAKVVINATGIFTDKILKMKDPTHKKTVIPSQGIHLMLERSFLDSDAALMIPKTSDGRVLFIIPWHDKVIAGTTDTLIKKPKIEPVPLQEEVDFILETINTFLTKKASRSDVLSVFSGLRPLAKPKKEETNTKEVSRGHKIIVDDNLVSIVGGKWTTYRKMAEDAIDTAIEHFDLPEVACLTKTIPIHGNTSDMIHAEHLKPYGSDLEAYTSLESSDPLYQQPLHPRYPYTNGQVIWAVRHEMARTIEDFLSRRIRLLLLDARAAVTIAPKVAELMARELNQTPAWQEEQVSQFSALAEKYILN